MHFLFKLNSTLAPDVICRACTYRNETSGKFVAPTWQDHPNSSDSTRTVNSTYYPSANVAPTRFTPVMYKKTMEGSSSSSDEIVVQPMMFGLIPVYHKVIF
jgi:hypothetical protein